MNITRIGHLIHDKIDGFDAGAHSNINGPSLVRVPDWVENPLGRYYLYFAHHKGDHIRMAYAGDIAGPYTIHGGGVLDLADSLFTNHIASPDVHVDDDEKRFRMYYHGVTTEAEQAQITPEIDRPFFYHQRTRVALSPDGLTFTPQPAIITSAYLRVVAWRDMFYGVTMPGLLYRSADGLTNFERGPLLTGDDEDREAFFYREGRVNPRHFALQVHDDNLRFFYSLVPGTPESIYYSDLVTPSDDWETWSLTEAQLVLEPETGYEGGNLPMETSARGWIPRPARQLRDPGIYEEDGRIYLLYSTAGELGIGLAEMIE